MKEKRLIEVDFPQKEVGEESVSEKQIIRRGHISTLHVWWARRPLAASRATIYAALTPAPNDKDELKKKLNFVARLSKWENSLNKEMIEEARKDIFKSFDGHAPKVLDCFAGGGSIPLEALRLGCETYALDYNPVAVLMLKAILEYPQKYASLKVKINDVNQTTLAGEIYNEEIPKLIFDVQEWGSWVFEEAKKEIMKFYPPDPDGSIPIGYIWARTVKCQNPSCGAEIPLMKQFWLCNKGNKQIALKLITDEERKTIEFKIVRGKEIDFDASQGTIRRATVSCPLCRAAMDDKTVRKLFQEGKAGQRMIAVILYKENEGKIYRLATKEDEAIYEDAEKYLEKKKQESFEKWGINHIPDEPLPPKGTLGFRVQQYATLGLNPIPDEPTAESNGSGAERALTARNYGMSKWGDVFNPRQKLALITFIEKIRIAYEEMHKKGYDEEYAKAVTTYLSFIVNKLGNYNSSFCRWDVNFEKAVNTFDKQALSMMWNYFEMNVITGKSYNFLHNLKSILDVLEHLSQYSDVGQIYFGTATRLPYNDAFFDAVITDPPYYDNIPYSYLSDFFYVWLKRAVGDLYPEFFATPLTPKSEDIVAYGGKKERKKFFEEKICQAFKEIHRVLKPDGIAVILFAHKSTEAWETIINSLLQSGLVLTVSWPIHTEMKTRSVAHGTAALASSVFLVCRKRTTERIAYFNEIKKEIDQRVKERLTQFWEQGISGADFFSSAIGPAVEVFSRYAKVERISGEEFTVKELLEYIRKVVSQFALERILKRTDLSGVDAETGFYLLWRWTFGNNKTHFDEVIKPSIMKKTKSTSMIDALHRILISWETGEKEKIKEILDETGYASNETFWQIAQALSEILHEGDKERQLLQGFLYHKETFMKIRREKSLLDYVESS